jgi:toxin ParE1/3/4
VRKFSVEITGPAAADLEEIYAHYVSVAPPGRAAALMARLETAILSLARNPQRGPYPPKLLALGVRTYRQLVRPPLRIVYRVRNRSVFVLLVADGRRDMRRLLEARLFDPAL